MCFWNVSKVQSQKPRRILDISSVQRGSFSKTWGQDPWAKRAVATAACCPRSVRSRGLYILGLGEVKIREDPKGHSYAEEDSQDPGDLPIVKLR